MNYKWTINLHDGYPLFHVMKPEGYILPSLHILKHDLSSLAPPKGKMKSTFSWTSLFKSPTSSTLCFGEPILGKLKQVKLLCSLSSSLYETLNLQSSIKKSSSASPSTFLFVTLLVILEFHSLLQDLPLKQTLFPTATPA